MTARLPAARAAAAELNAATLKAWHAYIEATERRIAAELADGRRFLALDFQDPARSRADRRALMAGEILVDKVETSGAGPGPIPVPGGMIHHWRGAAFFPGVTLQALLAGVTNPAGNAYRQEDVLQSRILERGPDSYRIYLRLRRSKIVTVVYNTEHRVVYRQHGPGRVSSRSNATKIAELENPGTAEEREKPEGQDRGFLWKLNSYWRYEQVGGAVIAECESITLSRSVPAVLIIVVRPIIDRVARESMQRTLASLREHHCRAALGAAASSARLTRTGEAPRLAAERARARSTRMRRIVVAAMAQKCARSRQGCPSCCAGRR